MTGNFQGEGTKGKFSLDLHGGFWISWTEWNSKLIHFQSGTNQYIYRDAYRLQEFSVFPKTRVFQKVTL